MYNRVTRRFDFLVKIINHNTMEVLEEYDDACIIGCEKDYTLADYLSVDLDHYRKEIIKLENGDIEVKHKNSKISEIYTITKVIDAH